MHTFILKVSSLAEQQAPSGKTSPLIPLLFSSSDFGPAAGLRWQRLTKSNASSVTVGIWDRQQAFGSKTSQKTTSIKVGIWALQHASGGKTSPPKIPFFTSKALCPAAGVRQQNRTTKVHFSFR